MSRPSMGASTFGHRKFLMLSTRPKPAAMPMKRCSNSRKNGFSRIRKLKMASVPTPPTSTVAVCQ